MEWKQFKYGFTGTSDNYKIIIIGGRIGIDKSITISKNGIVKKINIYTDKAIEAINEDYYPIFKLPLTHSYRLNLHAIMRELETYVRSI